MLCIYLEQFPDYLIMNKLRAVNKKLLDLLIVQMQKSDKKRKNRG